MNPEASTWLAIMTRRSSLEDHAAVSCPFLSRQNRSQRPSGISPCPCSAVTSVDKHAQSARTLVLRHAGGGRNPRGTSRSLCWWRDLPGARAANRSMVAVQNRGSSTTVVRVRVAVTHHLQSAWPGSRCDRARTRALCVFARRADGGRRLGCAPRDSKPAERQRSEPRASLALGAVPSESLSGTCGVRSCPLSRLIETGMTRDPFSSGGSNAARKAESGAKSEIRRTAEKACSRAIGRRRPRQKRRLR